MESKEKKAFEPSGLVPRSIVRTFERFRQQLLPGSETAAIREYRISRYQVLVSVRCLFTLLIIPIATNWLVSSWLLSPLVEHFWNTQQNEIFLNSYQEERAFAELESFSEKLFFESLLNTTNTINVDFIPSSCCHKIFQPLQMEDLYNTTPYPLQGVSSWEFLRGSLVRLSSYDRNPSCYSKTFSSSNKSSATTLPDKSSICKIYTAINDAVINRNSERTPSYAHPIKDTGLCKQVDDVISPAITRIRSPFDKFSRAWDSSGLDSIETPSYARLVKGMCRTNLPFVRAEKSCSSMRNNEGTPKELQRNSEGTPKELCQRVVSYKPKVCQNCGNELRRGYVNEFRRGYGVQTEGLSKLYQLYKSKLCYVLTNDFFSCDSTRNDEVIVNTGVKAWGTEIKAPSLLSVPFESTYDNSLKIKEKVQNKILELAIYYNEQTIISITNIVGDVVSLVTLGCLFIWMKPEITILKSFLIEAIYSLSDTTKSFLLILLTDLLVGFHSPRGWETALELLLKHFGLPENQDFVFLFVATFPVLLDTVFKYWIFRHLNKISPSTVATYHSMIE